MEKPGAVEQLRNNCHALKRCSRALTIAISQADLEEANYGWRKLELIAEEYERIIAEMT